MRSSLTSCPSILQANKAIKTYVRYSPTLLWKAAKTGIIGVWDVLVKEIEAEGEFLLQQVIKMDWLSAKVYVSSGLSVAFSSEGCMYVRAERGKKQAFWGAHEPQTTWRPQRIMLRSFGDPLKSEILYTRCITGGEALPPCPSVGRFCPLGAMCISYLPPQGVANP